MPSVPGGPGHDHPQVKCVWASFAGRLQKSLQPRQSGSFLYSSEVKTRSVARLTQKMIWEQFLILLKRLHLQCADGKQVHSFHQDPSPVKKASLRGEVECHRRENCEQARVLTRASPRRGILVTLQRLLKSLPDKGTPTPGGLRTFHNLQSREYPASP